MPSSPIDADTRAWVLLAAGACLLPLLLQLPSPLGWLVGAAALLIGLLAWKRPVPRALSAVLAVAVVGAVLALMSFRFGRDTGCALLAAMLAIKPTETRGLRDARSLLGFALFAPFATFLLDQGPLSLALGLLGALLALTALQRCADAASGERVGPLPWRQRFGTVARLLAIGLPLALVAFWLFPRLGSPFWGVPERALARPGLSDTMAPGEWIDLMTDDSPALRVRFFGRAPDTSRMYWRGPVMWQFDGREWTQPRWLAGVEPAPVQPSRQRYDYELEVEPTDRRQLVALDLPTAAPERARLSLDHRLVADRPLAALTRWRMQSAEPVAYEPQLRQTLRRIALALPEGYNPRTLALARQWRREAGSDDAAIVQRALAWIRRDFAYTLSTPLFGRHQVDEFLFDHRAGFCEHYSSAFVVLMRGAGIPARVVTGYTGGYRNPIGDYWIVRRSDAHAWAEVWLPQRGWVRVDPTAAVAPERIYDTLADRASAGGLFGGIEGFGTVLNVGDWLRRGWNDFVLGFDATRQQRLLSPLGIERLDSRTLGLLFGLAAVLALAWMLWLSTRGVREADPVLRAWHRLGTRYRAFGLERDPAEPALAWAERVARARPELGTALRGLSQRFSDWRYAAAEARSDRAATRALLRALREHRPVAGTAGHIR